MKKPVLLLLCIFGLNLYAQEDRTVGDKVGKVVDDTIDFFSDAFKKNKDILDSKTLELRYQYVMNRMKMAVNYSYTELKNINTNLSTETLKRRLDRVNKSMNDFINQTSSSGKLRQDIEQIIQDAKKLSSELRNKSAKAKENQEKTSILEQQQEVTAIQKKAVSTRANMISIRKDLKRKNWDYVDTEKLGRNSQWLENLKAVYKEAVEAFQQ